jgi:hypothetical protein
LCEAIKQENDALDKLMIEETYDEENYKSANPSELA